MSEGCIDRLPVDGAAEKGVSPRFGSERAKKMKVEWGTQADQRSRSRGTDRSERKIPSHQSELRIHSTWFPLEIHPKHCCLLK